MTNKEKIKEVAFVFFKMGLVAFGGPAAHVGMMEEEIVNKRKWMSRQHFLDLMGATNLIPGPNSTEMTMHCGHERAGIWGLFVAGAAFIFPAVMITGFLAWLYVTYGELPTVERFVFGIKPAVLAIIASAIFKLGKKALKNIELAAIGIIVTVACFLGVNEIMALLSAGVFGMLYFQAKKGIKVDKKDKKLALPFLLLQIPSAVGISLSSVTVFWTFLKVGAVLYGSGYVLFAYLDAELVSRGWLTTQELMDAIAVGQFTPGPVLSTATFVGYQLTGFWGAIGATAGIFLPSFLFVLILNPFIPKMRNSPILRAFLDAVNIAAVAIMLVVLFTMGKETLISWQAITIAALSFGVIFGLKKANPILIVLGGAILGYIL